MYSISITPDMWLVEVFQLELLDLHAENVKMLLGNREREGNTFLMALITIFSLWPDYELLNDTELVHLQELATIIFLRASSSL